MQATAQPQAKKIFSDKDGLISFTIKNVSGQTLYLDVMEIPTGSYDEAYPLAANEVISKENWRGDLWIACDQNSKSQPFRYLRSFISGRL